MGMFDELICDLPLPDGYVFEGEVWQTKDTPEQFMSMYRIRLDGTLWREMSFGGKESSKRDTSYQLSLEDREKIYFCTSIPPEHPMTKRLEREAGNTAYANGRTFVEYMATFENDICVEIVRVRPPATRHGQWERYDD